MRGDDKVFMSEERRILAHRLAEHAVQCRAADLTICQCLIEIFFIDDPAAGKTLPDGQDTVQAQTNTEE